MTNSDRLREIAERAEKATPGPWTLEWDSAGSEYPEEDRPWPWRIENVCNIAEENDNNPDSDGTFIAAAREDIPFLLSEITKLNAEKAETIEVLEELGQQLFDANVPQFRAVWNLLDKLKGES